MLSAIRRALGADAERSSEPANLAALPELGRVLAPVDPAELLPSFEQELAKAGASAYRAQSRSDIQHLLAQILTRESMNGVVLSRNPLLRRLDLGGILGQLGIPFWTWPGPIEGELAPGEAEGYRERCLAAAAGITGVEFALAESGSMVLSSYREGSQLSSLAPPIHIAFYLRSQVVETLEEVLRGLRPAGTSEARAGRSVVFITGTSRTADIEQILIRGVHGPREVHVILIDWELEAL